MQSKQISVFLENRGGRLSEVLGVLDRANVNIISCSLADTSDYGLLRIIVDDSEKGSKALSDNGFSAKVSLVTIVSVKHLAGSLNALVNKLSESGINVEYMYGLSLYGENASIVLKTDNPDLAEKVLTE
ncbi:MAG: hypothetical protein J6T42_04555 [Clostridia bacterium]|nr:hypothetical protein [Clostridia bacterium]